MKWTREFMEHKCKIVYVEDDWQNALSEFSKWAAAKTVAEGPNAGQVFFGINSNWIFSVGVGNRQ